MARIGATCHKSRASLECGSAAHRSHLYFRSMSYRFRKPPTFEDTARLQRRGQATRTEQAASAGPPANVASANALTDTWLSKILQDPWRETMGATQHSIAAIKRAGLRRV